MGENPTAQFVNSGYNRLGKKTFYLFLSQKISVAVAFLVFSIVVSIAHASLSLSPSVKPLFGLVGIILLALALVSFAVAFLSAWLAYRSYEFCLTDDALKIKHGVMMEKEIAIPYRQIQNVSIERTVSERMMGLSRIIIATAGHDDPSTPEDESNGTLPAIDKSMALSLQEELLKRADVQKVIQA